MTLAFSGSESRSAYAGMPLPPALITAFTVSSVTFLPFFSLSCLKSPFSDGPIFFSSLSVLWHTPHCSKTSLPFTASPSFLSAAVNNPASSNPPIPVLSIHLRIQKLLQESNYFSSLQSSDAARHHHVA